MIKFSLLFISVFALLSCSNSQQVKNESKVVLLNQEDSLFVNFLAKFPVISNPINFDTSFAKKNMDIGRNPLITEEESMRYLHTYRNVDEFYHGFPNVTHDAIGKLNFNDSTIGIIYSLYQSQYEPAQYILATYRRGFSKKPICKIVLFGINKGVYEINSLINQDFLITTTTWKYGKFTEKAYGEGIYGVNKKTQFFKIKRDSECVQLNKFEESYESATTPDGHFVIK